MKNENGPAASLRARVTAALDRVGLLPEDDNTKDTFIHLVRSVPEKDRDVEKRYPSPIPIKVLENIALLKIAFGLNNREVASIIRGDLTDFERTIRTRENEISLLADAYTHAKSRFQHLKEALTSGKPFEEIDLRGEMSLEQVAHQNALRTKAVPLHLAKALEKVRWSDRFQNGDPDAICLAAEKYIALGAIEIAEPLIEQVLDAAPDHPGGWFQKARLLLKKSAVVRRQSSLFFAMSEAADTLSAGERHYEELAHDEAGTAQDLRQQAFDACVKAYSLLPDGKEYEQSAIRWSEDYGTLRELRLSIMIFIVQEAGERCNPFRCSDWGLRERIEARLGRTQKCLFHPGHEGSGALRERVADPEKMSRLAGLPLFSETTDEMIVAAYRELTSPHGLVVDNQTHLQLLALNFLRFLTPDADYRREVTDFVESLRSGYAPSSGEYFGPFPGPYDLASWRMALHEHLDTIMSRSEQRDLVRDIYAGWVAEVNRRRDEALSSIYDDEVRIRYAAGDLLGAYQAACQAEADGIYSRIDGYGAHVLRRMAQHAARSLGERVADYPSVIDHLEDDRMKLVADAYCEDMLSQWDALEGPDPFPEHLWPED